MTDLSAAPIRRCAPWNGINEDIAEWGLHQIEFVGFQRPSSLNCFEDHKFT